MHNDRRSRYVGAYTHREYRLINKVVPSLPLAP